MSRQLPPLNALRAFEAAARHLSVSQAAVELHVTPAAISHQVKALEEWLGVPLFRRLNRQVLLTDAGQTCFKGLRDGFDRLAATVEKLRGPAAEVRLTVSAAPSFAGKWLLPRLERSEAPTPTSKCASMPIRGCRTSSATTSISASATGAAAIQACAPIF